MVGAADTKQAGDAGDAVSGQREQVAGLPAVLALCPPGARVAAWHRGERPAASGEPLSAWEPVINSPARPVDPATLTERRADSLVCGVTPMTTLPGRWPRHQARGVLPVAVPAARRAAADTLDDLFSGSAAVSRAWA